MTHLYDKTPQIRRFCSAGCAFMTSCMPGWGGINDMSTELCHTWTMNYELKTLFVFNVLFWLKHTQRDTWSLQKDLRPTREGRRAQLGPEPDLDGWGALGQVDGREDRGTDRGKSEHEGRQCSLGSLWEQEGGGNTFQKSHKKVADDLSGSHRRDLGETQGRDHCAPI